MKSLLQSVTNAQDTWDKWRTALPPSITFDSAPPYAIIRRNGYDIGNTAHYNESSNDNYLPPLIPVESEDSYKLPSIHNNSNDEDGHDSDFSIRRYEESGGPISSVMRNWVDAMMSITQSSGNASSDARCVVTDPSGKPVKIHEFKDLKPTRIDETCDDDYELPSLVVDDNTY